MAAALAPFPGFQARLQQQVAQTQAATQAATPQLSDEEVDALLEVRREKREELNKLRNTAARLQAAAGVVQLSEKEQRQLQDAAARAAQLQQELLALNNRLAPALAATPQEIQAALSRSIPGRE
jgi:hypothetical protein